jgi:hypothetical protein
VLVQKEHGDTYKRQVTRNDNARGRLGRRCLDIVFDLARAGFAGLVLTQEEGLVVSE